MDDSQRSGETFVDAQAGEDEKAKQALTRTVVTYADRERARCRGRRQENRPIGICRALKSVSPVAATAVYLAWRRLEVDAELRALS
jgi:hypothetical protein